MPSEIMKTILRQTNIAYALRSYFEVLSESSLLSNINTSKWHYSTTIKKEPRRGSYTLYNQLSPPRPLEPWPFLGSRPAFDELRPFQP